MYEIITTRRDRIVVVDTEDTLKNALSLAEMLSRKHNTHYYVRQCGSNSIITSNTIIMSDNSESGRTRSDGIERLPNGSPRYYSWEKNYRANPAPKARGSNDSGLSPIGWLILIIISLPFISAALGTIWKTERSVVKSDGDSSGTKIVVAQKYIKSHLINYPETLTFDWLNDIDGDWVTVSGTSKNGFGVPERFSIKVKVRNGSATEHQILSVR